ncbi:hypothetical protein [Dysgonomonas sp. ZJ279]|uniref:ISAon1 family transposase N-terminal region protein n=1 Tax=Dysgonomonas sp. ZJ279 TaxID=2709796 RepID=UPI001C87196F|nr:hypothetical protein [Dysgonomonas sp. ZJ279]
MQTGYELLLPEGLLNYFEVVEVETLEKVIILHLDEKVLSSQENKDNQFISKGFYPPSDIHDFPLRGKSLILRVRRRRWQNKLSGNPYMRDWSVIAGGTHLTAEFAAFLKALS